MNQEPGSKKSAQDLQDEIFRRMSADKKLEVASGLWRLAKALDPDKIDFRMLPWRK